jgi:uncharacterized membrane protein YfcA
MLPPDLAPFAAILIIATSFLAAAITAAASVGGGLLLIAVMSSLMAAPAVVPVHGVIMVGSNAGRFALLRKWVDWPTLGVFALGALLGGAIGSQLVIGLPASALRLAIAGFILFTVWGPKVRLPLGTLSIAIAGAISTFLTLFVGASGPFMTSILAKMPSYDRMNLIGTVGACMTLQHGFKVVIFALLGFAYAPWAPFIAICIAAGFAGTFLGTRLLRRIDEALFRTGLKWVLTVFAVYLLGAGLAALIRS